MTRDLILVALSLFAWGLGEGMFIFFQPIYLRQLGADPRMIGAILGAVGIAMTVAHLPAGYISDRIGQRPVMWTSWILGLAATGIMAMILAPVAAGFLFEQHPELVYRISLILIPVSILLNIWLLPGLKKMKSAAQLVTGQE